MMPKNFGFLNRRTKRVQVCAERWAETARPRVRRAVGAHLRLESESLAAGYLRAWANLVVREDFFGGPEVGLTAAEQEQAGELAVQQAVEALLASRVWRTRSSRRRKAA